MFDEDYEKYLRECEEKSYSDSEDYVTRDSGKRAEHPDGVVRDTDEGKPRFDLMFPQGVPFSDQLMTRTAELYERGVKKYSPAVEIGVAELVNWCSCGLQTAILTGITTLSVCAETAMNAISGTAIRNLSRVSDVTQPSGPSVTDPESAQQTWLITSGALSAAPSVVVIDAGPVSDWLLKTASDYLLKHLAGALSATMTLAQARTWITTTAQGSHADFCAHAVTKAWASSEIRQKLFGEHLITCSTRRLQATSRGIWCLEGRNWEKSDTPETLEHHEAALMRHVIHFLTGTSDGEDHAAAVVWNVNAVDLCRRKIGLKKVREDIKAATDAEPELALKAYHPKPYGFLYVGKDTASTGHYCQKTISANSYEEAKFIFDNWLSGQPYYNSAPDMVEMPGLEAPSPSDLTDAELRWTNGDTLEEVTRSVDGGTFTWVYRWAADTWLYQSRRGDTRPDSARSSRKLFAEFGPLKCTKGKHTGRIVNGA